MLIISTRRDKDEPNTILRGGETSLLCKAQGGIVP